MRKILYMALSFSFLFLFLTQCAKEDFVVPVIEDPSPENTFKYVLNKNVFRVDSANLGALVGFDNNMVTFKAAGNMALENVKVGDILFLPLASPEFHLTKFGRKVMTITKNGDNLTFLTSEPELKDLYEYFYIDITEPDLLQTRDTGTWIQMSDSTEGKVIDWNLLQTVYNLSNNYSVNFKMSNVTAKMDMRYKVTTEFNGANNELQNFTFKAVDLKLKDFTFGAEVEVKRSNQTAPPGSTTVVIGGAGFSEVEMIRIPAFVIPAGIPIQVSLDFGFSLEAAVSGKANLGIDFGDFNITGDTLEVKFATMSLASALWNSATSGIANTVSSIFSGYEVVSYPSTVSFTSSPCLNVGFEFQGFVKPSLVAGLSFAPVGVSNLFAAGFYMDIFGEIVGKLTYMSPCLSNSPPNLGTLQACIEINRGFKPPYLMFTSKGAGRTYSTFKIEAFGDFKNTMFRFPAGCDPFQFVNLGQSSVSTSCNNTAGKLYVSQMRSPLIADNGFFRVLIGNQVFDQLSYDDFQVINFSDFSNNLAGGTEFGYTIQDIATGRNMSTGTFLSPECGGSNCTSISDPNNALPTYPDQTYCDFIPAIPNYNRRWIRENMYYTPIHRSSANVDPFTDGRPYLDLDNLRTKDFGRLYTFDAANGARRLGSFVDWPGDICPTGYHIPSKTEWEELITAAEADLNPRKLLDPTWSTVTSPEVNESGFSIKPYGYYSIGGTSSTGLFLGQGTKTYFWTSTPVADGPPGTTAGAWAVEVTPDDIKLVTSIKNQGYFCRCVKN